MAFFYGGRKKDNAKIQMEYKRFRITKVIMRKNNKAGSITFPNFKIHYKATIIKSV